MIRKLLIPAACALLMGGCATYGYSDGGYYYGQPGVRYYGGASYGDYPYGYGYYDRYGSPYGYGGYGYPYYGYGYYGYPYYYTRRPPRDHGHHHDDDDDDHGKPGGKPPWRARLSDDHGDNGGIMRRRVGDGPRPVGRLPDARPPLDRGSMPRPGGGIGRVPSPPRQPPMARPSVPRAMPSVPRAERRAVPVRPAPPRSSPTRSERELRRGSKP